MTHSVAAADPAKMLAAPPAHRFRRPDTRLVLGLGWIVLLLLGALLAPVVAPHDPLASDIGASLQGPSGTYWLGTDNLGRDVFSRLLHGAGSAIGGVLVAIAVGLALGLTIGVVAGYVGGWFDTLTSRIADLILALPGILLLLLVLAVLGRDLTYAMIAYGFLVSAAFFRLARAGAAEVRHELFVDAATVAGVSPAWTLVRHVLPNMIRPIVVQASLTASTALLLQAGLSFLGLGAPPPAPQWGAMVQEASQYLYQSPWLMVPTGGVIVLTALAFNLVGDALTDERARPVAVRDRETVRPEPAVPEGSVLAATDLRVSFGDLTVVDGVTLAAHPGRTLALVGESGCGKTLTALALAGLLPPDAHVDGSVVLDGRELAGASEKELESVRGNGIAYISQEPIASLDPSYSIGSQLREPLKLHGSTAPRTEAVELLRRVGIADAEGVARSFPHQLSGGMAQRVAIAIALTGRPRVLIADEPTTALDVTVQAEILDLLREIQAQDGTAVVLVTHDWGVVADVADEVAVMYAGQVVEHGTVAEVIAAPRHPYTRDLLAALPEPGQGRAPLPTIPGSVPPPAEWVPTCRYANRCTDATEECLLHPVVLADRVRCLHPVAQKEESWQLSSR
ncbi:dipeptide/oligopeptide/nickel ABC transporter permease/ATP-binding protein [Pseudonocardia sp. NPDC049635]|uniref:dipeptide/oligopeptide/nickel ABC transporter permease/ATP-binding protein n=1 Tax=Pseudonocardia sp. NPDC049635 TaxID=3155506 RepID=UPI0033F7181F